MSPKTLRNLLTAVVIMVVGIAAAGALIKMKNKPERKTPPPSIPVVTAFMVSPDLNPVIAILLSGFFSAGIGVVFGIPSLRIKGFYLAIATLAAQFFLVWLFEKWGWLYNYNASGAIQVPNMDMFGITVGGPRAASITQYYVVLGVVSLLTLLCINLTRGNLGRTWKATRDMDIAAELIGINLMKSKLTAFAVSSYVIGVSGALFVFMWRGAAEPNLFDIPLSFRVLFIAIIGGLGSIMGNYLGINIHRFSTVFWNLYPGCSSSWSVTTVLLLHGKSSFDWNGLWCPGRRSLSHCQ